jgi:hypothetical protein
MLEMDQQYFVFLLLLEISTFDAQTCFKLKNQILKHRFCRFVTTNNGSILVITNSRQVLPVLIVHYSSGLVPQNFAWINSPLPLAPPPPPPPFFNVPNQPQNNQFQQ